LLSTSEVGKRRQPHHRSRFPSTIHGVDSLLRLLLAGCTSNAASSPPGAPLAEDAIHLELVTGGLTAPIAFATPGDRSGRLLVADQVGQTLWEEVDLILRGGNRGWPIRQGTHCFDPQQPSQPPGECPQQGPLGKPLIAPIIEYGHDVGISVIGGYVYHGSALPSLQGQYVFGDWSTSFVDRRAKLFLRHPARHWRGAVAHAAPAGHHVRWPRVGGLSSRSGRTRRTSSIS
jgi:hypothetical protein